jgi:hypothetical protein
MLRTEYATPAPPAQEIDRAVDELLDHLLDQLDPGEALAELVLRLKLEHALLDHAGAEQPAVDCILGNASEHGRWVLECVDRWLCARTVTMMAKHRRDAVSAGRLVMEPYQIDRREGWR